MMIELMKVERKRDDGLDTLIPILGGRRCVTMRACVRACVCGDGCAGWE